ncbi:MAG: precorrin-3B C(17)-methyltransferase [Azospirillaceae bacterium]|nr:precorrin-3B C(17)-methyltransferase [Azospirillaceae bacterium]
MTVILVLSAGAMDTARRIAAIVPGARIHGWAPRVSGTDAGFSDVGAELRLLFGAGIPIVGVCAAGLLIRLLAPVLTDKSTEPPVLAVAEDGSAVVPLLGGHHGANILAREIGTGLGAAVAITTASDVRYGIALDEPPPGWSLAAGGDVKAFAAALLSGQGVAVTGTAPWLDALPRTDTSRLRIQITDAMTTPEPGLLVYHPHRLAIGVGCERGADPDAVISLVQATLAEAGLAGAAVAGVYSLDLKADEVAIHAVATMLQRPARFFAAATLEAETPRLSAPSAAVFQAVGCHGVAEAAALAAAGPDGILVVTKRKSARATCAVARATAPFAGSDRGQAQGRLAIVGIGPGCRDWRTPEAERLIAAATDLVGYHLYLDLLGPLTTGKQHHGSELGDETARATLALELAAAGRSVVLVSSGDAGIYAMATLVFELLDRAPRPGWRRIAVQVSPGISALQAAAARAGAPLGHDFCAISLSDLLTPWPVIETRILAAAAADFVIAFYNPASLRRRTQLERACAILRAHRPADTPVILARNLGRDDEQVTTTTLGALDPAVVDMLTLVVVGATTSRRVGPWTYTPRGYAAKDSFPQGETP